MWVLPFQSLNDGGGNSGSAPCKRPQPCTCHELADVATHVLRVNKQRCSQAAGFGLLFHNWRQLGPTRAAAARRLGRDSLGRQPLARLRSVAKSTRGSREAGQRRWGAAGALPRCSCSCIDRCPRRLTLAWWGMRGMRCIAGVGVDLEKRNAAITAAGRPTSIEVQPALLSSCPRSLLLPCSSLCLGCCNRVRCTALLVRV